MPLVTLFCRAPNMVSKNTSRTETLGRQVLGHDHAVSAMNLAERATPNDL
jgi:hypothetical protein